ncbi:unnamed protein product [Rotaria sp. Silwood2]|nr:unnamed protein product [Rotaria sp. Silwood2]CAF3156197.1 unnamed protein product [Rotaria sp. Silwood2]CAF4062203.1 unnamed protein product [Rotaria sp. Silwood2]
MSTINNNSIFNDTSADMLVPVLRTIPFWIFTILIIPSIPCYLYIFFQCIYKGILRKHIRIHTVFAVLICSFLQVISELPTILSYLRTNLVPIQLDFFCKFWACQDYSFNVMILMLMGFTAIERYLLVFHNQFLQQHLFVLHYMPIIFCIIYPIGLYTYLIFFYPCINQFTYTMITCGGPCYFYQTTISILDEFIDLVLPVAVSSLASLALLSRVLWQKHYMQQRQMWKKNRRLVIQLLYIVILYNIVWLPMIICSSIMLFSPVPQPFLVELSINILPYGIYIVILLCPFVSLMSLPELWPRHDPMIIPLARTGNSSRPIVPLRITDAIFSPGTI